ncbi:hypothetical protein [Pedobacter nyackensis]|uniref:Uncharacterized protein n=1 Tax=Pedobacter nyackensis TaxID=475255 RepID=A0A1W2ELB4_9SPHI|nr:hypothetical protein [Pedobacter nyackensis]SMD10086.1 hypothetical protein SAMN04488101_11332 [Pedobacter nyackensis]
MSKIAEPWEPFEIQVLIEGQIEKILVVPDQEEARYQLFDDLTSLGSVWSEQKESGMVWCAEGMIARELLDQVGEQIEQNTMWLREEDIGQSKRGSGIVPGDQIQGSDADQDKGGENDCGLIPDDDLRGSDADIDR